MTHDNSIISRPRSPLILVQHQISDSLYQTLDMCTFIDNNDLSP